MKREILFNPDRGVIYLNTKWWNESHTPWIFIRPYYNSNIFNIISKVVWILSHWSIFIGNKKTFYNLKSLLRKPITENAKTLAFGHVFPELNHNEIVGWEVLKDLMKQIHVVMLRDKEDYRRIKFRMDISKGIIGPLAVGITEINSEGTSLLARTFSLLYLADWLSFYLAMLNGVDPSPVKKIDFLKSELEKLR